MKKYRLLKELPGFKIGEKVYAEISEHTLYLSNPPKYEVKIENNFYYLTEEEIEEWLEEIQNDNKSIFELEKGDGYYFIDNEGIISYEVRNNSKENKIDLELGNIFFTKYDAEKEIERRKVLTNIKRWIFKNGIKLCNQCDYGYVIKFNREYNFLSVVGTYSFSLYDIVFEKEKDAKMCLQECKEQREILFNLN